jgi:hypothetical protein
MVREKRVNAAVYGIAPKNGRWFSAQAMRKQEHKAKPSDTEIGRLLYVVSAAGSSGTGKMS